MAEPGAKNAIVVKCERGISVLTWAFFGIFAGFGAVQSLQSSLNATLGFINLACLYFAFVFVGLACPPIVSAVISRCGWHALLIGASCTYIFMILSNLDTGASGNYVQPIANVILGAGGALIWTTQNLYFGQCAYLAGTAGLAEGSSATEKTSAIAEMTTRFNSSFFGIFQFSNSFGCLVSSGLMLAFSNVPWMRTLLFVVLTAAVVVGTLIILLLPSIESKRDASEASPSVTAALKAVADPKFALMLPWIITQGMTFAWLNADYTGEVVSPLLSPSYVGFMMAAFYACDALFTILWGTLISKKIVTRRTVFMVCSLSWVAAFLVWKLWTREAKFEKVGDDWKAIPGTSVGYLDVALPLVIAVLGAAGDGYWNPGPPAILQSFFAEGSNLLASMAAYKALQSLGFAVQFTLGATLKEYTTVRFAILLACVATSIVSVLCLDRITPLDPRESDDLLANDCQS